MKGIHNRLSSFLLKHNVLSTSQFGFQKNKNTTVALLSLTNCIYDALNRRQHAVGGFVDFRKVIKNKPSNTFYKLSRCGVRGITLARSRSYLGGRSHCVRIDSWDLDRSDYCSVPQGSILAPVLFLIYINDLPNISNSSRFTLFADDTTLTCSDESYNNLLNINNQNLSLLYDWTINNRLALNTTTNFSHVVLQSQI